jgi:3'(2'), 5'-bisphosphate nucleotidase
VSQPARFGNRKETARSHPSRDGPQAQRAAGGSSFRAKVPDVTIKDAASCAELMPALTAVAVRAALVVRGFAGKGEVHRKRDGSPVTEADLAAEAAIRDGLARAAADLPLVSEEQAEGEAPRVLGRTYALVDPLDGTREFIAGSDEYAINIAIMIEDRPILGVIAAPALGLIWRGMVGHGAERMAFTAAGQLAEPQPIHGRKRPPQDLVAVTSRSHLDAKTKAYLDAWPVARVIACGSAIKFGRIAEGSADLYPRLGPVHDWDAAAGHALVEAAGGSVRTPDGERLRYGSPDRIIPGFIALADAAAERAGPTR